jgi:hypothetical protein
MEENCKGECVDRCYSEATANKYCNCGPNDGCSDCVRSEIGDCEIGDCETEDCSPEDCPKQGWGQKNCKMEHPTEGWNMTNESCKMEHPAYKCERATEGLLIFYIDVGQMPPFKAEAYLEHVKNNMDLTRTKATQDVIFIPVRPNSSTRVEHIRY